MGKSTSALRQSRHESGVESNGASPELRDRFERAYHDYLRARKSELAEKRQPATVAEHWELRRKTIFLEPYIDLWMILIVVDIPATVALKRARERVIDLVLIANDIGSIGRDATDGEAPDDLNLAHTIMREQSLSKEEAVQHLIDLYLEMMASFQEEIERGSATPRYRDLLIEMVDGNLRALRALTFRYPDVGPLLARLPFVGSGSESIEKE